MSTTSVPAAVSEHAAFHPGMGSRLTMGPWLQSVMSARSIFPRHRDAVACVDAGGGHVVSRPVHLPPA